MHRRSAVYAIFFLSGISGLIYQVLWVRIFGNVFGNTVYSAAVVTAVFMGGLGLGGFLAGRIGDRWFRRDPASPLMLYGYAELLIALLGLVLAFALPRLGSLSVAISSYTTGAHNWQELSWVSMALRYLVGIVLLAPSTLLMGATLTLLIRFVVAHDVKQAGWRVGLLYGLNTLGAAVGCLLTDLALVPTIGILATQLVAVGGNLLAAVGALVLLRVTRGGTAPTPTPTPQIQPPAQGPNQATRGKHGVLLPTSLILFLSGFAVMGLEIVWFRYLSSVLGGYRAVFSLLLAVLLIGLWLGSILGGALQRRLGKPVALFIGAQVALIVSTLLLLMTFDTQWLVAYNESVRNAYVQASAPGQLWIECWRNLRPILQLVGLPSLFMGFTFPLANAIAQETEASVGSRAGVLYLANTTGNVLGSLVAGFLLLPWLGVQTSVSVLAVCSLGALLLLPMVHRAHSSGKAGRRPALVRLFASSLVIATLAWSAFLALPKDTLLQRSLLLDLRAAGIRVLAQREGVNETLFVLEIPGFSKALYTNGYSMSGDRLTSQRYMRGLAHLPLLQMDAPERVLVICFGVGNTVQAASLHPSVTTLEVADLSRDILEQAPLFAETNHGVLEDPRVTVFVNDGRHHLAMREPRTYDLVTLEPPPLAIAGVSSLYTREFYELAKNRLREGGMLTQWLPTLQLSAPATLSLVRAFVEVFPDAVMLNGFGADMILLGRKERPNTLDPDQIARNLAARPAVLQDLGRIHLGTLTEIAGTFAASPATLRQVVQGSPVLDDDRPGIEYDVRAGLAFHRQPEGLVDVSRIAEWCPKCRPSEARPNAFAELPGYLEVMKRYYSSEAFLTSRPSTPDAGIFTLPQRDPAMEQAIAFSRYLQILLNPTLDMPENLRR